MSFKYRKKPVVIEAIQWTQELQDAINRDETAVLPTWFLEAFIKFEIAPSNLYPDALVIKSREGSMGCPMNNWIIQGVEGEIYSCDPAIFEKTYEKVLDTSSLDINNPG